MTAKRDMNEATTVIKEMMVENLTDIAGELVRQMMNAAKAATPATKIKVATMELKWPGEQAYLAAMRDAMTVLAFASVKRARAEVPNTKNIKLAADYEDGILFADVPTTALFEKLPKKSQDFIKRNSDLLVGTQISDLEKNLKFQYMDSHDTTNDDAVLEDDLAQVCADYIDGASVRAGAQLLSAKTVNNARAAFFFDDDVMEQLDALEFVNGDPVTEICQDLAGTVFAPDDPNLFRYTPPLHWNCKSYISPIPSGKLGNKEITKLKPSTKKLEEQIQFSEAALGDTCCPFHKSLTENNS